MSQLGRGHGAQDMGAIHGYRRLVLTVDTSTETNHRQGPSGRQSCKQLGAPKGQPQGMAPCAVRTFVLKDDAADDVAQAIVQRESFVTLLTISSDRAVR